MKGDMEIGKKKKGKEIMGINIHLKSYENCDNKKKRKIYKKKCAE